MSAHWMSGSWTRLGDSRLSESRFSGMTPKVGVEPAESSVTVRDGDCSSLDAPRVVYTCNRSVTWMHLPCASASKGALTTIGRHRT